MKDLFSTLWANRKFRLASIACLVLLVGLVVFNSLSKSTAYTPPVATITPFPSASHAEIIGNDIYSFDGVVFSVTDHQTGQRTVLSRPVRYPDIGSVWYLGKTGALATFKGSFDSTPAEKYVYKYNLLGAAENTVERNYLWYIDFSTGDISLVSTKYADNRFVYFDTASQKIYVLLVRSGANDSRSDTSQGKTEVDEFSEATKTLTKVIDIADLVDADGLYRCSAGSFCLSGTLEDGSSVLRAIKNGMSEQLSSSTTGYFSPTNNPDVFLLSTPKNTTKGSTLREDDPVGGPFSESLFTLSSKTTRKTSVSLDDYQGSVTLLDGENVSVLNNKDSAQYISVFTKNRLGWFIAKVVQTKLSGLPYGQVSYAEDGSYGIIASASSNYVSFGKGLRAVSGYDKSHYESVIGACVNNDETFLYDEDGSQFAISLIYGPNLQQRIDTLAKCIYTDTSKPSSAMLHITLVSPTTGQIVSN